MRSNEVNQAYNVFGGRIYESRAMSIVEFWNSKVKRNFDFATRVIAYRTGLLLETSVE